MRTYTRKHTKCSIEGCEGTGCGVGQKYFSRGYCHMHYGLWRRNGVPERKIRPKMVLRPCVIPDCCGESKRKDGLCGLHAHRKNYFGDALDTPDTKQSKGFDVENLVGRILRQAGHSIKRITGNRGDLLMDGKLFLEIKVAGVQTEDDGQLRWGFNIHRHGILNEKADYYIFRFEGVPGAKKPFHAAFKGPLGVLTVSFSMVKMLYTLGPALQLFEDLKAGKLSPREEN